MNKTSVYLTSEETARLSALAEREGSSQAEIIRRAIRTYEPESRGDRNFALACTGQGEGTSIADLTDDVLLAGFGT